MESKDRIIDLRQFIIYLWENVIAIILICVIFTGIMASYSYYKQKKFIASPDLQKKSIINDIVGQNHDAFYHMNDVKFFTDASQPAGTYNSSARLFVDFDFNSIEGNANLDFSQMASKVQQDVMIILVSDDALQNVIDELNLKSYSDMNDITPDKLKWMINRNFLGANVLQIVVTDVDGKRAEKIAQAVVDEFIKKSDSVITIDSVEVVDEAGYAIAGQPKNVQTIVNTKSIIKYSILGFFIGLIFSFVIYLLFFIINDAVRTSADISFVDMKLFGNISTNEKKREEDIKRIAYNISLLEGVKKITIVPIDSIAENDRIVGEIVDELKQMKKDLILQTVENIKDSSKAIVSANDSDAVILFAKHGKTRMRDLVFAKNELDRISATVCGTIICN